MSFTFEPDVQYGQLAGPFFDIDQLELKRAILQSSMESFIPVGYRGMVEWLVIPPEERAGDPLMCAGYVAWKYVPPAALKQKFQLKFQESIQRGDVAMHRGFSYCA